MYCDRIWGHKKQSDMVPTCSGETQSGVVMSLLGNHGAKVTLDLGLSILGPMRQDLTSSEKLLALECLAHL
jgi:hypothetical protein